MQHLSSIYLLSPHIFPLSPFKSQLFFLFVLFFTRFEVSLQTRNHTFIITHTRYL